MLTEDALLDIMTELDEKVSGHILQAQLDLADLLTKNIDPKNSQPYNQHLK